jgi:hypothetical protein
MLQSSMSEFRPKRRNRTANYDDDASIMSEFRQNRRNKKKSQETETFFMSKNHAWHSVSKSKKRTFLGSLIFTFLE